ncbi:MAG: polysaccharide biosynthesis C-terminal domain-containing protein, partial [Bacteroidota bacterium]|nr:polysaccharide biosynthesis C-terminal domain-containing protein [Bacteroidota bacterium]
VCLSILFFGDRVLMLVFDNSSLSQYSNLFKIFSVVGIFAGLSMIFTMLYLPAIKKYTIRMKIFISAAVFHLLVAIVLTRFYQIYGVVSSAILTELLLLLLGYYYYKRECALAKDNFLPKS